MADEKYTIYINNLNDKINFDILKSEIYELFSKYGKIVKIFMRNNILMKGQAFISYEDKESAKIAISSLNNVFLYNKFMNVCYSKSESHRICKKNNIPFTKENKNWIFQPKITSKSKQIKEKQVEIQAQEEIKNNILFWKNLPKKLDTHRLIEIFEYYEGFKEVRYFEPKQIAFIEFEKVIQAEFLKNELNNKKIRNDWILDISYAKKT